MPGAWAKMGGVREVRPRVRRDLVMIVRRFIGLDMDFSWLVFACVKVYGLIELL